MPRPPVHADRGRAEAFGLAADAYDRYRPRYPLPLIRELIKGSHLRALDVGAGTGIASVQMMEAGADVLAVEPDPRMARVAADNGVPVEQATFEDWKPSGRSFDLVVFAQSFSLGAATSGARQDRFYPAPWRSPGTAVQPNRPGIPDSAGIGRGLRRLS